MTREEIGFRLKQARLAAHMTQVEVAERLGKRQQVVGHWETGYSQPDANTLFTLCDLYKTTVDQLFGFTSKEALGEITADELEHIKKYRKLDARGKKLVDAVLDQEYRLSAQVENVDKQFKQGYNIPYVARSVVGGGLQYLHSNLSKEEFEKVIEDLQAADENELEKLLGEDQN